MRYINVNDWGFVETVDEFETLREAKEVLKEYRLIYNNVWISQRCTKDWRGE